jgi:DNA-binding GntR family transcriptional regulator
MVRSAIVRPKPDKKRPAGRPSQASRVDPGAKESLVERAYREIRRRILDNEYPPAHQVLEHELAGDLQMSRTPVREALVRLQNENFVQLIPRHGMRVVPLSLEDLRDMYEVLTALELTAIERLVKSQPGADRLEPLAQAVDDMDLALERRDIDAWVRADERFHRTLIELAGNARLAAMAFTVWEQGHRARMTTVRLRTSLKTSDREHRALLEAIRRGDVRDAKARHARHRARTSGEILNLLEQTRLGRI